MAHCPSTLSEFGGLGVNDRAVAAAAPAAVGDGMLTTGKAGYAVGGIAEVAVTCSAISWVGGGLLAFRGGKAPAIHRMFVFASSTGNRSTTRDIL